MNPAARRATARTLWIWLLGLVTLLLALWVWGWFTENFERRVETVAGDWSAAARRNPYLAAEQFLKGLGRDAESLIGRGPLRRLPPPTDTLIVRGLGPMKADHRQRLRDWIAQGGRLVVEAMEITDDAAEPAPDRLLHELGVILRAADGPCGNDQDAGAVPCGLGGVSEVVAEVRIEGLPTPIEVGFVAEYHLGDSLGTADGVVVADGRPRLLEYRIGDGRLIVLSDSVFMTNDDIGNHDHALFVAALAGDDRRRVLLLHDNTAPSLPILLWQQAPEVLVAAGILLLLLLWSPGGRLGPLLPPPRYRRRDLLLHLEAAAGLLWYHGRGGLQLAATRRRVERAWLRRHPLLKARDRDARAQWLADQVGLDAAVVDAALYGRTAEAELVRDTQVLQRLWSGV
jgi:hypothetical protein